MIPCCVQRREVRPQSKRRVPALSLAAGEETRPQSKGVAGSHKVMERGGRCKSSSLAQKWDFANGATGSDELARMKELAEELILVWFVAPKEL